MRKFIYIGGALILISVFFIFSGQSKENNNSSETDYDQIFFEETLRTSQEYMFLHWRTEKLLTEAEDYPDYETWKAAMEELKLDWLTFKSRAGQLEGRASYFIGEPVSWRFLPVAEAVTYGEITDTFDKAPAGRKMQTLAEYLGVDAQTAYDLLDQAQNYSRAEAWHEAGDTFQKLETSAVVIKDGCKVTGFVGGVVLSGGAAGLAGASAATKAAVVVSGADLALEVGEDGANIALGNNNKVSEFIGDTRKFTEPAATILTISNIPGNLATGYDKFGAVMVAADQFRSSAQEGKVIGIALPVASGEDAEAIKTAVAEEREDLDEWLSNLGYNKDKKNLEELMKEVAKDLDQEEKFEKAIAKGEKVEEKNEEEIENKEEDKQNELEEFQKKKITNNPSASGVDGVVQARFESPNEGTFYVGQARNWSVEVDGLEDVGMEDVEHEALIALGNNVKSRCHFTFYLNGVKYRERRDDRSCGFTSTFIDKEGTLNVVVEVEVFEGKAVYDDQRNYLGTEEVILDTITLNRIYDVIE